MIFGAHFLVSYVSRFMSLQSGDVILEIDGKPVTGVDSFGELTHANRKSKALSVRFRRSKRDPILPDELPEAAD